MYKVRLESFNGNVSTVSLPSEESVKEFLKQYPAKLPKGVALRVSCDSLSIAGTLVGTA